VFTDPLYALEVVCLQLARPLFGSPPDPKRTHPWSVSFWPSGGDKPPTDADYFDSCLSPPIFILIRGLLREFVFFAPRFFPPPLRPLFDLFYCRIFLRAFVLRLQLICFFCLQLPAVSFPMSSGPPFSSCSICFRFPFPSHVRLFFFD